MFGQLTPAHREEVSGVILAPIIERSPPTIKHDERLISSHLSDGGGADEVRVLAVHSLKFHTRFEVVLSGLGGLLSNGMEIHLFTFIFLKLDT